MANRKYWLNDRFHKWRVACLLSSHPLNGLFFLIVSASVIENKCKSWKWLSFKVVYEQRPVDSKKNTVYPLAPLWLILILSTTSLYKPSDLPELAFEVHLISVDYPVGLFWLCFPKLVYMSLLNSLVSVGHKCVFSTGFLSEIVVIIPPVHSEISTSWRGLPEHAPVFNCPTLRNRFKHLSLIPLV